MVLVTLASVLEALNLAIQFANSPEGKKLMVDLGSFFTNVFSSNSLAPNAAGTVQAGQIQISGSQLIQAYKYLESIGVLKVQNKTQAMQVSGVLGAMGLPVSQELLTAVLTDAPA